MVNHQNRKHSRSASKSISGQKGTVTSEYPEGLPRTEPTMTTSAPQRGCFAYFALPGEVRNQIMNLVLKPGDIHFPQTSTKDTQSLSGFQFLASNRQAYTEGRSIFYSASTFHLPPGPVSYTKSMFDLYQPQSLALLRRVTLHIGLHDLGYVEKICNFIICC